MTTNSMEAENSPFASLSLNSDFEPYSLPLSNTEAEKPSAEDHLNSLDSLSVTYSYNTRTTKNYARYRAMSYNPADYLWLAEHYLKGHKNELPNLSRANDFFKKYERSITDQYSLTLVSQETWDNAPSLLEKDLQVTKTATGFNYRVIGLDGQVKEGTIPYSEFFLDSPQMFTQLSTQIDDACLQRLKLKIFDFTSAQEHTKKLFRLKKEKEKYDTLQQALELENSEEPSITRFFRAYLPRQKYYKLYWLADRTILFLVTLGTVINAFRKAPLLGPVAGLVVDNICIFYYGGALLIELGFILKNVATALSSDKTGMEYWSEVALSFKNSFAREGRMTRLRVFVTWSAIQLFSLALLPVIANPATTVLGLILLNVIFSVGYLHDLTTELENPLSRLIDLRREKRFLLEEKTAIALELALLNQSTDLNDFKELRQNSGSIQSKKDDDTFHNFLSYHLDNSEAELTRETLIEQLEDHLAQIDARERAIPEEIKKQKSEMKHFGLYMGLAITGLVIMTLGSIFPVAAPILIPLGGIIALIGLCPLLINDAIGLINPAKPSPAQEPAQPSLTQTPASVATDIPLSINTNDNSDKTSEISQMPTPKTTETSLPIKKSKMPATGFLQRFSIFSKSQTKPSFTNNTDIHGTNHSLSPVIS